MNCNRRLLEMIAADLCLKLDLLEPPFNQNLYLSQMDMERGKLLLMLRTEKNVLIAHECTYDINQIGEDDLYEKMVVGLLDYGVTKILEFYNEKK